MTRGVRPRVAHADSSGADSLHARATGGLAGAATRGAPRTWRQFETLAGYLKELGIVEYRVNTAEFAPGAAASKQHDKRSTTASERMKRAHQAAAHDTWFRAQVQASIDDPRASVDGAVAKKEFAARRAALTQGVAAA